MNPARRAARALRARLLGRLVGTVVSVDTDRPWVALTFDDGPDPVTTPLLLDLLARHGSRATFFMVGRAARLHAALVARAAAEGHTVGHHTEDHVSLVGLDGATVRSQIAGGFGAVAPYGARLFRPPYGHLDGAAWWAARRSGHEVVAWSGHVEDWLAQDAEALAARLRDTLHPGAIVLLHDAAQPGEPPDAPRRAVLAALDDVLANSAWSFVTVPELMAAGRPRRRARWRAPV